MMCTSYSCSFVLLELDIIYFRLLRFNLNVVLLEITLVYFLESNFQ
jgi:hypothetical protein